MESPYVLLDCETKANLKEGLPLACRDLALCSEACKAGEAYSLVVGEAQAPLLTLYYPAAPGAGSKRAAGGSIDYRKLATLKSTRV